MSAPPAQRSTPRSTPRSPLQRMLAEAAPLKWRLALSFLLGSCAVGTAIGLLATSGYLIDKAALAPPVLSLGVAIAAVRFFGVSRAVFSYLERLVSHDAAFRFLRRLRVSFYQRLEPLVPGGLGTTRSGDLLSRFVADVETIQFLFLRALSPVVVAVVAGGTAAGVAAIVLPQAGLVLGAGLATGGTVASLVAIVSTRAAARREAPARGELADEIVELLASAPELVAMGGIDGRLERIDSCEDRLSAIGRRQARAAGLADAIVTLASGLTFVAVALVAIPAVRAGDLDGVWMGMLALLVLSSFEAVRSLPLAGHYASTTSAAAGRLFEIADRRPPVSDPAHPRSVNGSPVLRLEGARLRYSDGGPWVLDGVDLELCPGRCIALVGPSGAGKTTIANVLVRFQELSEGRATLDGHALADYRQEDVRSLVALADQDAHLFSTTIRENVRFAKPGCTDEEIEQALRRAGIWEWVSSLPEGLGTYVGETGDQVSGGQRRRIALARAFLSGAPLLVLDEPTAHLDRKTAEAVTGDLLSASGDAGLLLITHDEIALDRFDEVWRLDQGKLSAEPR